MEEYRDDSGVPPGPDEATPRSALVSASTPHRWAQRLNCPHELFPSFDDAQRPLTEADKQAGVQ
jgi:hypothetical protein